MNTKFWIILLFFIGFTSQQTYGQETEKEQDIKILLIETGSAKLGVDIGSQVISSYKETFNNVPAEFWDRLLKGLNKDDLLNLIIPIYDKYYTHEEIKELIAFYRTPIGKKTIKVLPQLSNDSMLIGQDWGKKLADKIYKDLEQEGYINN